jgi:glycosyltransferase involved in cell wall biosynthesis
MKNLKIAAFGGFRTIPPKAGGAGSDKFAFELYPRIVKKGHEIIAYCRLYPGDVKLNLPTEYEGIKLKYINTINKSGFDTLFHSFKATFDVIFKTRADIVHLHSGANSIWALFLRLAGKKVFVSQFAMDWKRDKWPWYGKVFYLFSNYLTAYIPNKVIFDNIFTKEFFEKKFKKKFDFIPYGSEVKITTDNIDILEKLGLEKQEYFLFVGRFIPDKGVHLLTQAFKNCTTTKKLVLIGGSPNPSDYERDVRSINDERIHFPGYIYGDDTNILIKNAYAYIQPSLIEGLSPVILTVMGIGTPIICSNIQENIFITKENAVHFKTNDILDLAKSINYALSNHDKILEKAEKGRIDVSDRFNWDKITNEFIEHFKL